MTGAVFDFGGNPRGPLGSAERLDPACYAGLTQSESTVALWILTVPSAHPAWDQYVLGVVDLVSRPGAPEPHRQFPAATHELLVFALDPAAGPVTAADVAAAFTAEGHYRFPALRPLNVVEQFTATDQQAAQLAWMCTGAALTGMLRIEPGGIHGAHAAWAGAIASTLNHYRDPHHGALN